MSDEFHYIFNCTAFVSERRLFIPKDLKVPNIFSFQKLFNHKNTLLSLTSYAQQV